MVVYKAKKSDTGGQFYQSEGNKRELISRDGEPTKAEKAIEKTLLKKYLKGDVSPEDRPISEITTDVFMDSINDAIDNPPKSKGTGKAVMKGRGGKFKGVN